jgi:hypothetical protein
LEGSWQDINEVLVQKPVQMSLYPPQIPHGLAFDRISSIRNLEINNVSLLARKVIKCDTVWCAVVHEQVTWLLTYGCNSSVRYSNIFCIFQLTARIFVSKIPSPQFWISHFIQVHSPSQNMSTELCGPEPKICANSVSESTATFPNNWHSPIFSTVYCLDTRYPVCIQSINSN